MIHLSPFTVYPIPKYKLHKRCICQKHYLTRTTYFLLDIISHTAYTSPIALNIVE